VYLAQQPVMQQPAPVTTTTPGSSIAAPKLTFTNSRNNTTALKVGDTWTIQITGAGANLPVGVVGVHDGASSSAQMGTTDSQGNFRTNGTFDQSVIGNWQESWYVNGAPVGSIAFTVADATGSTTVPNGTNSGGFTQTPGSGSTMNMFGS